MKVRRGRKAVSVLFVASIASAGIVLTQPIAVAVGTSPLSHGSTKMVSTLANGTSVPVNPALFGANEIAISDDGKVVAFTSDVPAEELVTDPLQTGHVHDNNTDINFGAIGKGLDVFVYDSRPPSPLPPIISLVSWNSSHTGTGNGPADSPVMAPHGVGLVFRSSATDLTAGAVDNAFQQHLYAWVPIASDLMGVFLVDNKLGTHDACDCISHDPSISLFPPTVVFLSNGNDMVASGFNLGGGDQVFANNVIAGTNTLVSVDVLGHGVAGGAGAPMIASDAPVVVFTSSGNDLTAGFTPVGTNVWVRNLLTSTTTLVSTDAGGDTHGTTGNHDPVINNFGTGVTWSSNDPNVTTTPFASLDHIFYRVILPLTPSTVGPTLMVDTNWTGAIGCNQNSNNPGISGDGLAVVFESNCSDIVDPSLSDSNGDTDVFIRHFPLDVAPQLVSINDDHTGTGASGSRLCSAGGSFETACASLTNPSVAVNLDGTVVAFVSNANNIAKVPLPPPPFGVSPHFNDGNIIIGYPSLAPPGFSHPATVTASVSVTGENPQGSSGVQVISADGGSVAYVSFADDLVDGDANGKGDVFLTDIHNSFVIQPVSAVHEGDDHVTIALHRSGNMGTTDTIDYETGDGSTIDLPLLPDEIKNPANSNATQPGDYTETTGSLVFPPGIDTLTFDVPITDDLTAESPEIFHVSISSSDGAGSVALPGPLSEAYVVILDDDGPPQDWHVNVSTPPPATAQVGDTVNVGYTVSVDVGTENLSVTSVGSGAGTTGLDTEAFPTPPVTVVAGTTSTESMATARVVAVPGSPGVHLELSVDGSLGAVAGTRTADTSTIGVGEAVTATLQQTIATPALTDQITYTLTVSNQADTDAQLSGLPAGFVPPAGTSLVSRVDGATTVPANDDSVWTLTVDVDDTDVDATTITQTPAGVMYAMSAALLPARVLSITPPAVVATVAAPVVAVGPHTLHDVDGGTLDPGDLVDVSITVSNTGGGDVTSAQLDDTLTDLTLPANVAVDGVACGACSTTASSVTAPLGAISSNASTVVTFSAEIPASPGGSTASSSASVTFAPATTGTSPTAADVASLTIGAVNVPTVSIAKKLGQPDPANASPVEFTVTFSAPVSGFGDGDVNLSASTTGGGSLASTVTGGPTVYNVAVTGMTAPGNVITSIDAGVAKDASNNDNLASPGPATVGWDATNPTVTINQAIGQTDPATGSTILYTVVFSEPVANFATGDVTLSGTAGATAADVTGSGTTYSVSVTGMTVSPGSVIATIAAGVASDDANNPNSASTSGDNTVTWAPDLTPPTVTINKAAAQSDPTSGTPVLFTVVFSESVSDFTTGDVTLGGTAGATTANVSGSGTTYTVSVFGMMQDGTVVASIAAGAAHDAASNANTASTSSDNSVDFVLPIGDTTNPTVTINSAVGQETPTSPITFTVVFSEPVPDFATGDVTVTGTAGATTGVVTGSGTNYSVDVSDMVSNGTVTVAILSGVAHDAANNGNDPSANDTVVYDTLAPGVTIAVKTGQADPTNATPIEFTVTFTEPVTGFTGAGVTLGGTANPLAAIVTPVSTSVYTVGVTGMSGVGTVTATVGGSTAVDLAGNANAAAPSLAQVGFDSVAPSVTINQAVGQTDPTSAPSIDFTVVFSESVSNFATGDVTLSGTAGATAADVTGSGTTYTVAVSGMTSSGTVIASLAAGVASDAAGNLSGASTSTDHTVTFNVPPDNVAPTVTINQAAAQADPSTGASVLFTVVFSEAVGGFTAGDIALSGTAGATTAVISGSGPTYTVTVTGMTQTGTVIASIPAGVVTDAALNANAVSTSTDNTVSFIEPTIGVSMAGCTAQVTVISGGELISASSSAPQVPPPSGVTFPCGQLNFSADSTPGGLVVFQITLSSAVTDYYKLVSGAWQLFTFDGETGAQVSGNIITVTIRDNGRGDSDSTSGKVTDPGAPAVLAQVPPTTSPTTPPTTPTTTPGALPPTGSSSTSTLIVAMLMMGVGTVLLTTRRRTTRTRAR